MKKITRYDRIYNGIPFAGNKYRNNSNQEQCTAAQNCVIFLQFHKGIEGILENSL